MTALRVLTALGTVAAVAVAAGGGALLVPLRPAPGAAAAPGAVRVPPPTPAGATGRDVEPVPPGILARAAGARALDRGPVCSPVPTQPEACAPPRDSVEIEWDVAPER